MVVHDFHVVCIAVPSDEADSPLVVDPNAELPFAVALQRFQSISAWRGQIRELRRKVQLLNLTQCNRLDRAEASHGFPSKEPLGSPGTERHDHASSLSLYSLHVKRYTPTKKCRGWDETAVRPGFPGKVSQVLCSVSDSTCDSICESIWESARAAAALASA
jgi:hypothetical protein